MASGLDAEADSDRTVKSFKLSTESESTYRYLVDTKIFLEKLFTLCYLHLCFRCGNAALLSTQKLGFIPAHPPIYFVFVHFYILYFLRKYD